MKVLQKKTAPRQKAGVPPAQPSRMFTFPSPTRGWVLNENIGNPGPAAASILDNWICTTKSIRARGGANKYATIDAAAKSIFTYSSGTNEKLFASSTTAVYDLTTVADPAVTPAAAISGQTSGGYSSEQFGTAGGDYLYIVNGDDSAQLFDGTTWQAVTTVSSPIAITGVATADLSHVWSYGSRLFFVEKGTKSAWYLGVDSIGGAANEVSMAGIFRKGGSLLFGATWSQDSGAGLDDKCLFVSTEGEVAVYEGTNPGSASDWRLAGVYDITDPIGQFGTMRAGGDLLIATKVGLVPISIAPRSDVAALSLASISAPIAPYWQEQADVAAPTSWEVMKWPEKNVMIVSQPNATTASCLVANLQTGAWSRITGWDTQCLGYYQGRGFFGDSDGVVMEMEVGGSDNGTAYTCAYLGQHEMLGVGGMEKTVLQMRAIFQSATNIRPLVTVAVNYGSALEASPSAAVETGTSGWDIGIWDDALWDETVDTVVSGTWASVGRSGFAIAPQILLTFNNIVAPDVELASLDATYEVGAGVT